MLDFIFFIYYNLFVNERGVTMILGKFELNEYLRNELDNLGYKNVDIWNILIQLRDETLPKNIQQKIKELEIKIQEIKNNMGNIGVYTREYKKIQELTREIYDLQYDNYNKKHIEPLEKALDDLLYSKTVETTNKCMKIAINFIKENA